MRSTGLVSKLFEGSAQALVEFSLIGQVIQIAHLLLTHGNFLFDLGALLARSLLAVSQFKVIWWRRAFTELLRCLFYFAMHRKCRLYFWILNLKRFSEIIDTLLWILVQVVAYCLVSLRRMAAHHKSSNSCLICFVDMSTRLINLKRVLCSLLVTVWLPKASFLSFRRSAIQRIV